MCFYFEEASIRNCTYHSPGTDMIRPDKRDPRHFTPLLNRCSRVSRKCLIFRIAAPCSLSSNENYKVPSIRNSSNAPLLNNPTVPTCVMPSEWSHVITPIGDCFSAAVANVNRHSNSSERAPPPHIIRMAFVFLFSHVAPIPCR